MHIDPTMLITSKEWHILAEKANKKVKIKKTFILTYFLGEISIEEREYISSYAESSGATVIEINMLESSIF